MDAGDRLAGLRDGYVRGSLLGESLGHFLRLCALLRELLLLLGSDLSYLFSRRHRRLLRARNPALGLWRCRLGLGCCGLWLSSTILFSFFPS